MNNPIFAMTGYEALDDLLEQINNGADINIQNINGETALMIASYNGNINICKLLIEKGADVNIQDDSGYTALILASYYGYGDIFKLLIENNADINIQNNFGNTALMVVSSYGYVNLSELLIKRGANVNLQDNNGANALIWTLIKTSYYDSRKIETCKLLIENRADINIEDDFGNIPIDIMKKKNIYKEVEPYKILGSKYFKEVFKEVAEEYMDIFETTLYSQDLELGEIKANIEMFYSNVVARMYNNAIDESVEL